MTRLCEMWQCPAAFYMMTFPMWPPVLFLLWNTLRCPLDDTWRSFLALSVPPPPQRYAVGQSCRLIRLGSAELITLLPPLPCYSSLPGSIRPRGPPPGSRRWASPGGTSTSSSSAACCLLGNQQGAVLIITKPPPYTCPLLSIEGRLVWNLPSLSKKKTSKEMNDLWRAARGAGPSCRVKWGERICSGFCSFVAGLGVSLRGMHGRRTVGFAAAWPPALNLVPEQLRAH